MKKIIAIMLTIILAMSVCMIPTSAANAESINISDSTVSSLVEEYFATVTGVDEDADITVSSDLLADVAEEGNGSITKTANALSNLIFVKASDVDEATLEKLMADTDCTVTVNDDGSVELYVAIDLASHPELFKIAVFRAYVKEVVDNSDAYFAEHGYDPETTEATLVYDEYLRFAGELALHMIVYDLLSPFAGIVSDSLIDKLVNKAVYAEINHSESRAPIWFLVAVGYYFMNIAKFIEVIK